MSQKLFVLCALLFLSVQSAFSQTIKDDKKDEELKKEAAAFLRETAVDVSNLRTLENRISFSAEIANLMWFEDEKESQAMFQKVIVDFRQLLMQIDVQYTALDAANEEADYDDFDASPNSKRNLSGKLTKAISVRQQIALSMAEHEPQMAYDFFVGTAQVVTNAELRAQFESSDPSFEMKLINALADKDADRALEAGRKILAKGVNFEIIGLLKKIYEKDADKGVSFGEEIISKIKSDGSKSIDFYLISSLLGTGEDNRAKLKEKPGKKPMFSDQSMREIADLLGQEILTHDDTDAADLSGYIAQVEKYSPARAAQIRRKFGLKNTSRADMKAVVVMEDAKTVADTLVMSENAESEENFYKQMQNFGGKQLSKEEKEKLVADSRATIAKIKSRDQKVMALSILASQIALGGDKELAGEIMNEARNLVNLQPKNYRDYLLVWLLVSGYAAADADKAFPILEDATSRLNETISAFIKVGEFIDIDEELIEGEEVQLGSFGGGMTRELISSLDMAGPTMHNLAVADFARTKALTNKFDRPEIRILAKMLVLRAVLGDKKISAVN
ncbi:MAG TPA: hypothetical protein VGC76_20225 [Pyrinomonadaceae bacterium]|jgi:hypothetical protein